MEYGDLIQEIREEYQIPPYFPYEAIRNYVKEGEAYLMGQNPVAKIETDETYKSLLKNYVYYAYHHRIDDFVRNYAPLIMTWKMGCEYDSTTNL